MLLMDVLSVLDENKNVDVVLYDEVVTRYDGRDSIDEFYNDYKVSEITTKDGKIIVEIYE